MMAQSKPNVSVIVRRGVLDQIMSQPERDRLAELADVKYQAGETIEDAELADLAGDADAFVYSWGSPKLDAKLLAMAPRLQMVAYGAGTVKGVTTDAFWERDIVITSGAPTIAIDVAQTSFGLIFCSLKCI